MLLCDRMHVCWLCGVPCARTPVLCVCVCVKQFGGGICYHNTSTAPLTIKQTLFQVRTMHRSQREYEGTYMGIQTCFTNKYEKRV